MVTMFLYILKSKEKHVLFSILPWLSKIVFFLFGAKKGLQNGGRGLDGTARFNFRLTSLRQASILPLSTGSGRYVRARW